MLRLRALRSLRDLLPMARQRRSVVYTRRMRFEPLEDRRLLTITVNTLIDENDGVGVGGISLRDALAAAAAGETINFAPSLTSSGPASMPLTNGNLVINKSLTVSGPGDNLL